ncbi:hypothetical protein PV433_15180 [Paenibacillus sp. GYB004]|uniref:hypothetical protein n=1 Tax=Paenibacillus sp. GYB004 TaxID=2994393 RepID=UPI002F969694
MNNNLFAGIPEELTRFTQLPNQEGHNAVWDFVKSPGGRFYVSVCGENEKPLTALLYEYDPESGGLRLIFDVAKVWIVDSQQMPPSKIHTSIDFLPDGRLIMATHNTAPAPGHKQWMYEQYYEHPWEGYPGSILMIVDPDTNEVQVRGIPVPRESMYGGMLGNDPRYYYFLGYMRGHLYRIDLDTNEVKDYGKVSEFSSCRLVKDAQGRLYGSSYTGGIWRFDPEREKVQDLKVNFVSPNGTKHRRQFIFAVHSPRNSLFLVDNMDGEMIELHTETLAVTRHGPIHLRHETPVNPYGIGGLAADDNFVLYYGLKTYDGYFPIRLVRWDILNGGEPENLGLIAPQGKDSQYICEMIFDRDGWLHMVDVCGEFSPYILAVDMKKLQPPGPGAPNVPLRPYTEPDYNGVGRPAFMHIVAGGTRTMPLHQYMSWNDTAVRHVRSIAERVFTINGGAQVLLAESDAGTGRLVQKTVIYDGGAPLSCVDVDGRRAAVLTADGKIVETDLRAGTGTIMFETPEGTKLTKLHLTLKGNQLLASDPAGTVYVCDPQKRSLQLLHGLVLTEPDAHPIRLDDDRLLLSGAADELVLYDLAEGRAVTLPVKVPSIRGRAFRATVTGGAALADGTVVAGTADGMLFTLSADHRKTTSYGRLYSSGQLRCFVRRNGEEVFGVYGGARDAGHVFHFSCEHGFTDLGRPRVIKDNAELRELDSEWASIHSISCLAYSPEDDSLCVGSGELYGCVVRYTNVAVPGQGGEPG